MEQSFTEFSDAIQKRSGKGHRKIKVTGSWGVYSAYKAIRKHNWYNIGRPVTEKEFYAIIRGVNKLLAEEILLGKEVKLPACMGALELRKTEVGVRMKDGKLKITYPINWNETLKLWYEDAEARKDKLLLRHENKYVYHIRHNKFKANFENKCFYLFQPNKFLKMRLKDNIKNGKTDTLW